MMPKSLDELLAQADDLAAQFEAYEPKSGDQEAVDAVTALHLAALRRAAAERELAEAVERAREQSVTWEIIGKTVGTTGESARQRYGSRLRSVSKKLGTQRSITKKVAGTERTISKKSLGTERSRIDKSFGTERVTYLPTGSAEYTVVDTTYVDGASTVHIKGATHYGVVDMSPSRSKEWVGRGPRPPSDSTES